MEELESLRDSIQIGDRVVARGCYDPRLQWTETLRLEGWVKLPLGEGVVKWQLTFIDLLEDRQVTQVVEASGLTEADFQKLKDRQEAIKCTLVGWGYDVSPDKYGHS